LSCGDFIIADFFPLCFFFHAYFLLDCKKINVEAQTPTFIIEPQKNGITLKITPFLVPVAGLEPARTFVRGILRLLALNCQKFTNTKYGLNKP